MSAQTHLCWLDETAFLLHVACPQHVWRRVYAGQATGKELTKALAVYVEDLPLLRELCARRQETLSADLLRTFVKIDAERCGIAEPQIDPTFVSAVLQLAGLAE